MEKTKKKPNRYCIDQIKQIDFVDAIMKFCSRKAPFCNLNTYLKICNVCNNQVFLLNVQALEEPRLQGATIIQGRKLFKGGNYSRKYGMQEVMIPLCKDYILDTFQDFLIKLDIKPLIHLLEMSIFALNNVILRLTNIMNRADKNRAHFQ